MAEYFEISVEKTGIATELAVLVRDADDEQWIPRSVISIDSLAEYEEADVGDMLEIEVETWFLEKEGLV